MVNNIVKEVYKQLENMDTKRIRVGDLYMDCAYHPCIATFASIKKDDFEGISLIDGSGPRCCSWKHCGITKIKIKTAMFVRNNWSEFISPTKEFMIKNGWWDNNSLSCKIKDWDFIKEELIKNGFEKKIKIFERYIK